ncbi:MAG: hypothetical protein Q4B40_07565, partial [Clostridia bacterium]|nr:hypothetical protein [Clostridia bacterium]
MKFNGLKKGISALLAVCVMATSAGVVFANETPGNITLTIKDVTESDTTTATAKGQAKFEVSMQGASGNAKAVQVALNYEGDDSITYKSTNYMIGDNDPDNGAVQIDSPKSNKGLWISVVDVKDGIGISNNQTLFIVTFEGDEDKDISLKCIDFENTYVEIDGNKIYPDTQATASAKTSTKGVDTITGKVVLTMDKVTDFSVSDGAYSGITLKITSETTGNTISVVLSKSHKTGSGNTPVYEFNNKLIDDTYTVELSGIGYVTYKKTGVTFDETLNITN